MALECPRSSETPPFLPSALPLESPADERPPFIPNIVSPSLDPDRESEAAADDLEAPEEAPPPPPMLTIVALSAVSFTATTSKSTQYTTPSSPPAYNRLPASSDVTQRMDAGRTMRAKVLPEHSSITMACRSEETETARLDGRAIRDDIGR